MKLLSNQNYFQQNMNFGAKPKIKRNPEFFREVMQGLKKSTDVPKDLSKDDKLNTIKQHIDTLSSKLKSLETLKELGDFEEKDNIRKIAIRKRIAELNSLASKEGKHFDINI